VRGETIDEGLRGCGGRARRKRGDLGARQLLLESPDDVRAQLREGGTREELLDAVADLEADPVSADG
jgi:hypothetical protein